MAGPFNTPVDVSVPFDGTEDSNGAIVSPPFVSQNVRDGIIEARETALGAARYTIPLTYNGNINNNTFIGYLNTIPGNVSPIIFAVKSELQEFTFTNRRSGADYTLEFRRNSTTAIPFFSVTKVNTQFFFQDGLTQGFDPGDQIYVKYVSTGGTDANDIGLILFFKKVLA
jgi:hypothetical protein